MKKFLLISLLLISTSTSADPQVSNAQRVQGVRAGYGDPVQVTIVDGTAGTGGGLTDTELRAAPVPVSISGTVDVSGPLTDIELRLTPIAVTGSFYQSTQPVSILTMPTTPVTGTFWQATQPVSGTVTANINGTVPVSGTFWQATQPISGTITANAGSGTFAISAASLPLPTGAATETTLAAISTKTLAAGQAVMSASSPVVIASNQSAVPVSGIFYQATQPVSIASMPSTPVTGTFFQATQPVSGTVTANAGTGTFAVSGPLTDTQLRASAVPVSGTFFQATQPISGTITANAGTGTLAVSGPLTDTQLRASAVPISGTVTITPPTLTKGTQGATGLSTQDLKDAGRTTLAMTSEFAFAQTAETLLTMTLSSNSAATTTFSSRVVTSGKRLRLQSAVIQVELLGSGTAPQRVYLRLRSNTAGATTASSPLQVILPCGVTTAIVKATSFCSVSFPDGMEFAGDGTATFGFTLETPDWVTSTATGRSKLTVTGYEY